jgi:hypothetical protein
MKRLWKKGDIIVPRLNKCPVSKSVITILEVKRGKYEIRDEKNKKELIEAHYLDCGYINEDGNRVTDWVKQGELDEQQKKNTTGNNKSSKKKTRKTETNSNISETSNN